MPVVPLPIDARPTTRRTRQLPAPGWLSRSTATRAGWVAFCLGLAYAAISVYWGLGGTWLLGTVGGSLERAGRQGGLAISLVLWAAAGLKVAAAVLPLLAVGRRLDAPWQRTVWASAWVECAILTGYGLVLTGVGLLIQAGLVPTGADADHRALAWHAFLWDPWFLVWGLVIFAALWLVRRDRRPRPGV
jgi:Protein of unknown function (DUF3995)